MTEKMTPEQAYNFLIENRNRENPRRFLIWKEELHEEYAAQVLCRKGFMQLVRKSGLKGGTKCYPYNMYELVAMPHNPPKLR
jgi:hypothetical protein